MAKLNPCKGEFPWVQQQTRLKAPPTKPSARPSRASAKPSVPTRCRAKAPFRKSRARARRPWATPRKRPRTPSTRPPPRQTRNSDRRWSILNGEDRSLGPVFFFLDLVPLCSRRHARACAGHDEFRALSLYINNSVLSISQHHRRRPSTSGLTTLVGVPAA